MCYCLSVFQIGRYWWAVILLTVISVSMYVIHSMVNSDTHQPYVDQRSHSKNGNSYALRAFNSTNHDLMKLTADSDANLKLLQSHNHSGQGYLVYHCNKLTRPGKCKGWSDRLNGIFITYLLSLLTNQTFKIVHTSPCQLENYLIPNTIDWRIDEKKLLQTKSISYNVYDCARKLSTILKDSNLKQTIFKSDVNLIRLNWDYTKYIRHRTDIVSSIPWLSKFHISDVHSILFHSLFRPSDTLVSKVENIKRTWPQRRTNVCAHIRMGKNPNMPKDPIRMKNHATLENIWLFLERFVSDLYNIIIVTDSDAVLLTAKQKFPENFVSIPGNIWYIDDTENDCDTMEKNLVDFYILWHCDILVLSKSGFGLKAAQIRSPSKELYCALDSGAVVPCSRYTLPVLYPDFFAPWRLLGYSVI